MVWLDHCNPPEAVAAAIEKSRGQADIRVRDAPLPDMTAAHKNPVGVVKAFQLAFVLL